jgi:hypothetical protein
MHGERFSVMGSAQSVASTTRPTIVRTVAQRPRRSGSPIG